MSMETIMGGAGDWRAPLGLGRLLSRWSATTFATVGAAAGQQALLAVLNGSTDRRLCVPYLWFCADYTAALTGSEGQVMAGRDVSASIGGGTALVKALLDTRYSSSPSMTVLGATASNGGALTALTGVTFDSAGTGSLFGLANASIMHTLVGQRLALPIPLLSPASPPVLNPGEALVVAYVGPAAQNPATASYVATAIVEEYGG